MTLKTNHKNIIYITISVHVLIMSQFGGLMTYITMYILTSSRNLPFNC